MHPSFFKQLKHAPIIFKNLNMHQSFLKLLKYAPIILKNTKYAPIIFEAT